VTFAEDAIEKILELTERYAYFLQQWAYESWNASKLTVISGATVDIATKMAIQELDKSFSRLASIDAIRPRRKTCEPWRNLAVESIYLAILPTSSGSKSLLWHRHVAPSYGRG
jgi:hypothetical protein